MYKIKQLNLKLLLILCVAFVLRLYGINWDSGFHLHPDERMILMVADRIHFFKNLNPDFFNYGSLPIYLLKGTAQGIDFFLSSHYYSSYQGLLYIGRSLSILFDLGTIFLIYKIARLLFSVNVSSPPRIAVRGKLQRGSRELLNWIPCQARNDSLYYLPSFFYAIAFFSIQNSHFFTVDVLFTFLTTLLLYRLLIFVQLPLVRRSFYKWYHLIFISIIYSALLATKFTAIIFLPIILLVFFFLTMKQCNNVTICIKKFVFLTTIYLLLATIFSFIFMPYAFLDPSQFIRDVSLQLTMNKDPYIFPYTLQYVNTLPYWYYLKNIFLWGLGPVISVLSLFGLISFLCHSRESGNPEKLYRFQIKSGMTYKYFLFFTFYFLYFLVIGSSAVKFMRYILPMYPFFAIMAGFGLYKIQNLKFKSQNYNSKLKSDFVIPAKVIDSEDTIAQTRRAGIQTKNKLYRFPIRSRMTNYYQRCWSIIDWIPSGVYPVLRHGEGMTIFDFLLVFLNFAFLLFTLLWTLMFINIYSQPNTRVTATEWILKNIPRGSTLAVEYWDDYLPIYGGDRYHFNELHLYNLPDDNLKWDRLGKQLEESDYIIIASNRLYTPLQRLADCNKYRSCYPKTAEYYRKLFKRELNFKKVTEFSVYPKLEIGNWKLEIRDDVADESFTVFDHPKVIIFKRK